MRARPGITLHHEFRKGDFEVGAAVGVVGGAQSAAWAQTRAGPREARCRSRRAGAPCRRSHPPLLPPIPERSRPFPGRSARRCGAGPPARCRARCQNDDGGSQGVLAHGHDHRATGRGVLHAVLRDVLHGLGGQGASPWKMAASSNSSTRFTSRRSMAVARGATARRARLGSAHLAPLHMHGTGVHLRDLQQRGHEPRDALDHRFQLAHGAFALAGIVGALHHGQHEGDGRERRANLVRDVGQGVGQGVALAGQLVAGTRRRDTIFDNSLASTATSPSRQFENPRYGRSATPRQSPRQVGESGDDGTTTPRGIPPAAPRPCRRPTASPRPAPPTQARPPAPP